MNLNLKWWCLRNGAVAAPATTVTVLRAPRVSRTASSTAAASDFESTAPALHNKASWKFAAIDKMNRSTVYETASAFMPAQAGTKVVIMGLSAKTRTYGKRPQDKRAVLHYSSAHASRAEGTAARFSISETRV